MGESAEAQSPLLGEPHQQSPSRRLSVGSVFKLLAVLVICTLLLSWLRLLHPQTPQPAFVVAYEEFVLPTDLEARTLQRFNELFDQGKIFYEDTTPRLHTDSHHANFEVSLAFVMSFPFTLSHDHGKIIFIGCNLDLTHAFSSSSG